jgi:hypothetical protein
MKNITKSLIALFALVAISCSVEDVQDRPIIEGIDTPVLTAPTGGAAYVLSPATADAQAERFTWNSANYGGDVEVNYKVEIDKKGNSFKTPQELGSVKSQNQTSVSVSKMNTAALTLGAIPFSAADYEVRVKSDVGGNVMYSNVVAIVVTPYTTEAPKLWIPGSYQAASGYGSDWTPSSAPQLASSGYGKTDFEGYVYLNNATAQYKFTPAANWDAEFGEAGATDGVFTGVLKAKPAKNCGLPTATAGYYLVKADTDPAKLSYSLTATTWGIIGNATPGGWTTDTPMVYNKDTKKWTVTATLTTQAAPDNGLKFRANNDWPINYGDTGNDGILDFDGKNIGTTAGTYLITLDLSNPRHYTYTMVKQ